MKAERKVDLILFSNQLERRGWVPAFQSLLKHKNQFEVYIVGGALRDALLGVAKIRFDVDLLVDPKEESKTVAHLLAKELDCNFFDLDPERDTYRISREQAQIDINGIRGNELIDDLFLRDFSIDALCLPLDNFLNVYSRGETLMSILDYFQGVNDLRLRRIRIHNPSSFEDDPLRLLRAYRLAGEISGKIESYTEEQIALHKEKLFSVSGERIRDEWMKLLAFPNSFDWLIKMDQSGLLSIVFPFLESFRPMDQKYTKKLQVRHHTLETLQYLEGLFQRVFNGYFPHASAIEEYLKKSFVPERNFEVLLKLASLLHDIGKPDTLSMESDRLRFFQHEKVGSDKALVYLEDLKLANKEIEWIEELILQHMRPHQLSVADPLTDRAKYRFFADLGENAVPLLLLALADAYATKRVDMGSLTEYEDFVSEMLDYAFKEALEPISPLLDGNQVMALLGIEPSPMVGRILSSLLEAQYLKQIHTIEEAREFVLNWQKTSFDENN